MDPIPPAHDRRAGVPLALAALALWSTLATLAATLRGHSPFLTTGLALTIAGLLSLPTCRRWPVPPRTFAVGVLGIGGYHCLLYAAYAAAPPVEANLVQYLWPLLIVLLSPIFLPGVHLGKRHVAGAVLGLAGAVLAVSRGAFHLEAAHLVGYLLALAAAFTWASYSLLTRRLPRFTTAAVGGFCLASGLLALGVHALLRPFATTVAALNAREWLALLALGAGPMGSAFFLWDAALKRADPRTLGALAYLTPPTSTLLLMTAHGEPWSWTIPASLALIVGGAALSTRSPS